MLLLIKKELLHNFLCIANFYSQCIPLKTQACMDCSNTTVPGIETFVETFQNHHFHKDLKPAMLVGVGPSIIKKWNRIIDLFSILVFKNRAMNNWDSKQYSL